MLELYELLGLVKLKVALGDVSVTASSGKTAINRAATPILSGDLIRPHKLLINLYIFLSSLSWRYTRYYQKNKRAIHKKK
jgi:hypothetical protein